MFGLGHIDALPFLAGLVYALGLWSMWHKWLNRRYAGALIELAVFVVLFRMHGNTMTGGVGATIAALIVGSFFPVRKRF
jgi:hypothetical protein